MPASGRKQTSALRRRVVRCYFPLSTQSRHFPPMPRAVISVLLGKGDDAGAVATFNTEWELVEQWLERWRDNMATCPENFEGCGCCFVYWEVDAPQGALDELPSHLSAGTW